MASQRTSIAHRGVEFAPDSLLEETGFELPVPRAKYVRGKTSPAWANQTQLPI